MNPLYSLEFDLKNQLNPISESSSWLEGAWMMMKITGKDSLKYFEVFQMADWEQK